MPITRKDLITQKITELNEHLKPYIPNDLFPTEDDLYSVDIADIVLFISMSFPKGKPDYREEITNLLENKEIVLSKPDFNIVYEHVSQFIAFIRNL